MFENFSLRPIQIADNDFLWDMLYEMVYVPEQEIKPDKDKIWGNPDIRSYLDGFGERPGDMGFIAQVAKGKRVAAGWYRLNDGNSPGYGFVAHDCPEIALAVVKEYRGQGFGSRVLEAMIKQARVEGYPALSLSVDARNPSINIYQRIGFATVKSSGTSRIMRLALS